MGDFVFCDQCKTAKSTKKTRRSYHSQRIYGYLTVLHIRHKEIKSYALFLNIFVNNILFILYFILFYLWAFLLHTLLKKNENKKQESKFSRFFLIQSFYGYIKLKVPKKKNKRKSMGFKYFYLRSFVWNGRYLITIHNRILEKLSGKGIRTKGFFWEIFAKFSFEKFTFESFVVFLDV